MGDAERRRELIRAALAERLAAVRARAEEAGAPEDPPPLDIASEEDPEETLRVLMVRLWPRVRAGDADSGDYELFFSHLARLGPSAAGEDWRFLDAWNNAYEAIMPLSWSAEGIGDKAHSFLQEYAILLEGHIRRLAS